MNPCHVRQMLLTVIWAVLIDGTEHKLDQLRGRGLLFSANNEEFI